MQVSSKNLKYFSHFVENFFRMPIEQSKGGQNSRETLDLGGWQVYNAVNTMQIFK